MVLKLGPSIHKASADEGQAAGADQVTVGGYWERTRDQHYTRCLQAAARLCFLCAEWWKREWSMRHSTQWITSVFSASVLILNAARLAVAGKQKAFNSVNSKVAPAA